MPMATISSSKLLVLLLARIVLTISEPTKPLDHLCLEKGNFTSNSNYESNLHQLLSSLPSNASVNHGFYGSSFGQNEDKVNAIALCRGDTKPDACRSCILQSSQMLKQVCPNQKEAIIWYDDCMLRYSNRSILGTMEFGPYFWMYNKNNVSKVNQFEQELEGLLDNLTTRAASGDSLLKFSTANVTTVGTQTIYALVQCTPDLSKELCTDCLGQAVKLIPKCCVGRQGGRVVSPSCHFRYEKDIFYDPEYKLESPAPSPSSSQPKPRDPIAQPPNSSANTKGMIQTHKTLYFEVFSGLRL
ncbi:hypothetical protein K2173_004404 [Erythroxylum novogranatense]|uniref:Gnk2-homologous domain-containing protein n=1 Tax=Erythroxylum novogranatense TaxID=1862640 RepID=A0AAV8T5X2_9ROSI|nr:hypothetical protein K2173_004404 [Erythroxylum novogranatense]